MPSTSKAQEHLMSAVAHGWKPTGSAAGLTKKVATEFHEADKAKGHGGHMNKNLPSRARGQAIRESHSRKKAGPDGTTMGTAVGGGAAGGGAGGGG